MLTPAWTPAPHTAARAEEASPLALTDDLALPYLRQHRRHHRRHHQHQQPAVGGSLQLAGASRLLAGPIPTRKKTSSANGSSTSQWPVTEFSLPSTLQPTVSTEGRHAPMTISSSLMGLEPVPTRSASSVGMKTLQPSPRLPVRRGSCLLELWLVVDLQKELESESHTPLLI